MEMGKKLQNSQQRFKKQSRTEKKLQERVKILSRTGKEITKQIKNFQNKKGEQNIENKCSKLN